MATEAIPRHVIMLSVHLKYHATPALHCLHGPYNRQIPIFVQKFSLQYKYLASVPLTVQLGTVPVPCDIVNSLNYI